MSQIALSFNKVGKSFGATRALHDVSLQLTGGGVVAVLGQNGAGKTTLIRAALGLTEVDTGAVSLFAKPAHERASRERIGVMLQDSDLPDLLSGRELTELFASYYPLPMSVEETIRLADIGEFADKRYKKLSGGQKRRVQFALAIIGNPDLIFLDEPTTGLDIDARKALWSVVRAIAKNGKTVVLTTHYLEEADSLADRIVVMREGKVVADAPTQEIRSTMGGSIIRCHTTLKVATIESMDSCIRVSLSGRFTEIHSSDSVRTLRELFKYDEGLTDLTVSRPSLEDVVVREAA